MSHDHTPHTATASSADVVLGAQPLGEEPMPAVDPFIFAVYHEDSYPPGNGQLGVAPEALRGRDIGMDFSRQGGWSMYHGEQVPGFPAHPHRGFETVTVVRKGLVDHADSLGAAARYGQGDVQWLTTGRGVQHSEMFPLVDTTQGNPLDLFQIWLNLPARSKMAPPGFDIFWGEDIPHHVATDAQGRRVEVEVIAGAYAPVAADGGTAGSAVTPLSPPPDSWASQPGADVAIWIVRLEPGTTLHLPAASAQARRVLYFVHGGQLVVGPHAFTQRALIEVRAGAPTPLHNPGDDVVELLVLQGRPIGEPVAARGPFVMNQQQELSQAIRDYQQTQFGGWPWPSAAPTHQAEGRFARYPDGTVLRPLGWSAGT